MLATEGNLQSLTGGLPLKVRIQHPGVHERTDRGSSYWYFRYWDDVPQAGGTTKAIRKFRTIGPSKGETRLSKKQAEVERDKFLATINKLTIQEKVADGLALFSKMVEKYRAAHVEAEVAGRFLLANRRQASGRSPWVTWSIAIASRRRPISLNRRIGFSLGPMAAATTLGFGSAPSSEARGCR
jgi:hypothetical protein